VRFVGKSHIAEQTMEEGPELWRKTREKQIRCLTLSTGEHEGAHLSVESGDVTPLLRIGHERPRV
jgi:hypothetical protein